jgi:hypothetical protein
MTTWILILVPALVLPIVLLFSFAGCALVAPLDEHVAAQPRLAGPPKCTVSEGPSPDKITDVTCDGKATGLGGESIEVKLAVTGQAKYNCNSQRPAPMDVRETVTKTFAPTSGQVEFSIAYTFDLKQQPTKCAAGTTASLRNVSFTSVTLTISQGGRPLFTCRSLPGTTLQAPETVLLDCGP